MAPTYASAGLAVLSFVHTLLDTLLENENLKPLYQINRLFKYL